MYASTSATWLSRPVKFTIITSDSIAFHKHLNCPSPSMCLTLKPLPWYAFMICHKVVTMVVVFLFLVTSAVPMFIEFNVIMIKVILFIYIIPTVTVTLPFHFMLLSGNSLHVLSIIPDRVLCVVFLLGTPYLGLGCLLCI